MGLTFKRDDTLDTMFDKFAIDPDKKDKDLVIDPADFARDKELTLKTEKEADKKE